MFAVAVVAGHLASLPGSNRYVSLMFDTNIFFFSSYVKTANLIVIILIYILLAIITHHMRSLCLDIRLSTLGSFGCVVVVQHGQSRSMQCLPRRGGNSKTSAIHHWDRSNRGSGRKGHAYHSIHWCRGPNIAPCYCPRS